MCSIIFGPFRLLGNAHLFNWLFRWLVGVDMWCQSCRPEVRIQRRVREKIRQILNLLKMFKVRMLSNSNVNFVTSLTKLRLNFFGYLEQIFCWSCVSGVCNVLFLHFWLSVPVQWIAWKDSSLKDLLCVGRDFKPTHSLTL